MSHLETFFLDKESEREYCVYMKDSKRILDDRMKVSIPFKGQEKRRFNKFLYSTGRKAGPFIRTIAIEVLEEWESEVLGMKNDQAVDLRELLKRN